MGDDKYVTANKTRERGLLKPGKIPMILLARRRLACTASYRNLLEKEWIQAIDKNAIDKNSFVGMLYD